MKPSHSFPRLNCHIYTGKIPTLSPEFHTYISNHINKESIGHAAVTNLPSTQGLYVSNMQFSLMIHVQQKLIDRDP